MPAPAKSLAIVAARNIIAGDVQFARDLLRGCRALPVAEARAMIGACKEAGKRYGCELKWTSFLAW